MDTTKERLLTETIYKSFSDVKLNWKNPKFLLHKISIEKWLSYTHDVKSAESVSETLSKKKVRWLSTNLHKHYHVYPVIRSRILQPHVCTHRHLCTISFARSVFAQYHHKPKITYFYALWSRNSPNVLFWMFWPKHRVTPSKICAVFI